MKDNERSQSPLEARNGTDGYPPTDHPANGPPPGVEGQQSACSEAINAKLRDHERCSNEFWERVIRLEVSATNAANERIELLHRIEELEAGSSEPANEASPIYAVRDGEGWWRNSNGDSSMYPTPYILESRAQKIADRYGGTVVVLRMEPRP